VSGNARGMTLVEVLVAVFVITIGLVAVATGMQLATSGVAIGQQQTTAVFLLGQRIENVKAFAVSTGPNQGWANVTSANFAAEEAYGTIPNYGTYRRTTTIANPTATTKRVTVSVFWIPVAVSSTANAERSVTASIVLASRS
jgi:prepilin-type N-terminal cleavage/methylation domain-containing protein